MRSIESHTSWARRPFARHQVRAAERDQHQADADARTGQVLSGLPSAQWRVVSDFEHRTGHSSHVLVGGGGVYLVMARKPDGCVRVKDGVPWSRSLDSRGERVHTDVNRKVLEPVQSLERRIRARSARHLPVHPVVVLWCEFPQRVVETGRITFVHGRELATWLRGRTGESDPTAQAEVADVVRQIAEAGTRRTLRSARSLRAA